MNKKIEVLKALKERLAKQNVKEKHMVNYNGKEYDLERIYQLTKGEESHICLFETEKMNYVQGWGVGMTGDIDYGYHMEILPNYYVDIETGRIICFQGHEKEFGFEVSTVSEEQFEEFANASNNKRK